MGSLFSRAGGLAAVMAGVTLYGSAGAAEALNVRQQQALDIFRQLVDINTTQQDGDTHAAAQAMAARLVAAGLPQADVQVFETAARRGNLVARLRGNGSQRPMLLLAHLDVVDADPTNWSVDPYRLTEKDGYYYARGAADDKYMAAACVAILARLAEENYRPERDIILALTSDEEVFDRHGYGMRDLLARHRDLIDAEFALNEGGGVAARNGKPLWNTVQTSEKLYQDYWLEADDRGGHSSMPRADNAIYRLAAALARLAAWQFPAETNETTRDYFARMAATQTGQVATDMRAVATGDAPDAAAAARLSADPAFNALLRTTCVATRLEGGHANNALAQKARALVNCRIMPGRTPAEIKQQLGQVLGDARIGITLDGQDVASAPSPADSPVFEAIAALSRKFWPGIPVIPSMSAGFTDSRLLRNAGIPTYGNSGLVSELGESGVHGRDERVAVTAFYQGQEYLYQLIKRLAGGR